MCLAFRCNVLYFVVLFSVVSCFVVMHFFLLCDALCYTVLYCILFRCDTKYFFCFVILFFISLLCDVS